MPRVEHGLRLIPCSPLRRPRPVRPLRLLITD
jgi:hypothetical protein